MRLFAIFFAIGVLWLQQQEILPPWSDLGAVAGGSIALAAVLLSIGWFRSASAELNAGKRAWVSVALGVAGLALGFCWAGTMAQWRLAEILPAENEGIDIQLTGVVAALPQTLERGVRFEFDVEKASKVIPPHISLAWYRGENNELALPRAGERWQMTVRLKRPHGNSNPHGMDYEGWLLERGIRATGYVRPRGDAQSANGAGRAERIDALVIQPSYLIERWRERIRDRFLTALPDAPFVGVLIALVIGDQQSIAPDLWQSFSRTGITHLMSISGSHITMLAALAYLLLASLWRRSAWLPLRIPVQQAAACGGLVAALGYCLLAGFAVPAQRTLYMLAVAAMSILLRREMAATRVLALALLVVLLFDPWAVLAAGFWLSFGAVALLLYVGGSLRRGSHWLRQWSRAQWAVTLGMLPALLALFQQFSLVSPLANAVAIPLVSFVITPLALAATLPGLEWLLPLAHGITSALMWLMQQLSALPLAVWQQAAPPFMVVAIAVVGGVWVLLPRGFPARWLGLLAFLPLLSYSPPRPGIGEAKATVLDVGQGLSVHVQTAQHDLVFDAGPAFSADADSGNRIIVPYLRAGGVRRLDMLVISHADRDHSGGAESVLAMVPVAELKTSLPFEHMLSAQPVRQTDCLAGDTWEWDGVRFDILHPGAELVAERAAHKTNDLACVLRVSTGDRHLLLTSDIEAAQEIALVDKVNKLAVEAKTVPSSLPIVEMPRATLAADVLVVPHHGSRTSSTPDFIAAVGASDAIFPVGYRNHFGHPKQDVVDRYRQSGARLHRTDLDGAVRIDMAPDKITLHRQREEDRRYWHGR